MARWSGALLIRQPRFGFERHRMRCQSCCVGPKTGNEVGRSEKTKSDPDQDFTAVATVSGLAANTEYQYSIELNGKPNEAKTFEAKTFRTLMAKGEASKFVIAFGGGAGYVPENERMWDTIGSFDPHAILLLGDNVYIDDPESVVMQQYTYHRRQSRHEWRKLTARSPVFTIWDDHDFSTNDSWGGADIEVPFWKKDWVFPIFRQNWAHPGYGGGDDQPGCWFSFSIGDVDFIMLDCRYYRTKPKKRPRSMLGTVQKKWLKEQLTKSSGTFKVICSSVPWDFRTKGDSNDTCLDQAHQLRTGQPNSDRDFSARRYPTRKQFPIAYRNGGYFPDRLRTGWTSGPHRAPTRSGFEASLLRV